MSASPQWHDGETRLRSGVTGTSSGTGIAGLGYAIGPDTTLGKVLIFLAPLASILVGGGLLFADASVRRWFQGLAAAKARRTLQRAISNPDLPAATRAEFRAMLVDFERTLVAQEIRRVTGIGELPQADSAPEGSPSARGGLAP